MTTTAATNVASPIVSGTTPAPTSSSSGSSGSSLDPATNTTLAGNFQTFLTLLTTQLQNQNPRLELGRPFTLRLFFQYYFGSNARFSANAKHF